MRDVAAVADSGPLIFLARIDLLDLLPELFAEILIPPEVRDEVIMRGRNHPGAYAVGQAKWLTVQAPDPRLVKSLSILVDAGEAEAIALAQTTEACTVLLDDLRARKVAQRLDIKQIGTVGLLLRAKKRGLLESIKPHLDTLLKSGIYICKELVEAVLRGRPERSSSLRTQPGDESLELLADVPCGTKYVPVGRYEHSPQMKRLPAV